ncbi:helix-turn-helix domain-containing protein [Coleofasciculus sp. FACHB-712]|uniref:helix-turn-helix domain-containing protein n=1 Tax=Coleofasciculus sp. FACHB-712 TaxID=2692789 RepID=UPI0016887994|nr:helix-turn-helix domain-containing protein [Coleofasciculus sp. FACHB-712]MBD1944223.1 helix-turn-helix domain-containing protein [Coleofasciculus sp. FACHB-712]
MPRTVRIHPDRKQKVISALERNGFLTQGDLAAHLGIALSTVSNFINSKPIYISKFEEICVALGLDKREITQPLGQGGDTVVFEQFAPPEDFFAYDSSWVGREKLISELSEKVRNSCRLLLIVGLTGIGKTALAERLAVQLQDWFQGDWKNRLQRANFDNEVKPTDFTSIAARWLEEWGENIPPEDNKPERLLQKLVKQLRENQVLVLIDSLERLLTGNEKDGWGDFADEWWEKFFVSLLSAESCQSRLIITSQDLPIKLVDFRYKNFWHRQVLYGLDESEQVALFETTGLNVSNDSSDRPLLLGIGKAYQGHPLVLRVIIGEILSKPFDGNVQAYWNEYGDEIEEVEKALAEAEQGKSLGEHDNWQLHKLTHKLRRQMNIRLEAAFERLKRDLWDAYLLICAASVYRTPVQQEGWLMQLVNLVKRLEQQECSAERQDKALEELCNRFLVEESVDYKNKRVLGQHNLVRSVALAHYKKLFQSLKIKASSA